MKINLLRSAIIAIQLILILSAILNYIEAHYAWAAYSVVLCLLCAVFLRRNNTESNDDDNNEDKKRIQGRN